MEGKAFGADVPGCCFGAAPPPVAPLAGDDFFAAAFSLARVMPFALSLSISCFRPSAVVGIGGLSMLRGSEFLGAVDGVEVDGLLGVDFGAPIADWGLLVEPDIPGIAGGGGAPCYRCQR